MERFIEAQERCYAQALAERLRVAGGSFIRATFAKRSANSPAKSVAKIAERAGISFVTQWFSRSRSRVVHLPNKPPRKLPISLLWPRRASRRSISKSSHRRFIH